MTEPPATRIGLISPCGWGNLGDAAIVESVIQGARRRLGDPSIVAFTMNPDDTRTRHGIDAAAVSGVERPGYRVVDPDEPERPADEDAAPRSRLRRAADFVVGLPGPRDVATALRLAADDRRHGRRIDGIARELDHVVVAGGGQLDDFWGGALGHPYALARWGRRARRFGIPFSVLSVGTGTLGSIASRSFVRDALRHANTVSFRDAGSRELAGPAAAGAPVVPDLVYGLPVEPRRPHERLIAVSPMSYCAPGWWAVADEPRYRRYIDRLAQLTRLVLDRGFDVVVLSSNRSDDAAVADLVDAIGEVPADRLRVADTPTHDDYLDAAGAAVAVVATRLHGILLAHLAGRPALALSYDRKVDVAMHDVGHAAWCVAIDEFDPAVVVESLMAMVTDAEALGATVTEQVAAARAAVDRQYDEVFGVQP